MFLSIRGGAAPASNSSCSSASLKDASSSSLNPLLSICLTYLITVGRESLSAFETREFENFSFFNRMISLIIIAPIVLLAIFF